MTVFAVPENNEQANLTPIFIETRFYGPLPKFVMDKVVLPPLTCSVSDANWNFKLPPVVNEDRQNVSFRIKRSDQDLFELSGSDLVIISNEKRKLITRGIDCPRQDVKFVVEINSDILGEAIYDFYVPVPTRDKNYNELSYSDDSRSNDG